MKVTSLEQRSQREEKEAGEETQEIEAETEEVATGREEGAALGNQADQVPGVKTGTEMEDKDSLDLEAGESTAR